MGGRGTRTNARFLRLVVEGDRLTLRPARFGLALTLGVVVGLAIGIFGLTSALTPPNPTTAPRSTTKVHHPWEITPTGSDDRLTLTPQVPIEVSTHRTVDEPLAILFLKSPWAAVLCGCFVFQISSLLFRERIMLDRSRSVLTRDSRIICPFADIVAVEVDDTPRMQVMNVLALLLKEDKRFSLILYNGRADKGLHEAAETIAAFIGVPVIVARDYPFSRGKKTQ